MLNDVTTVPPGDSTPVDLPGPLPFAPALPPSLAAAGLRVDEAQGLALKFLLPRRRARGSEIAAALRLPLGLLREPLAALQHEQLVAFQTTAGYNDFVYELLETGARRARELLQHDGYVGPAPVPLESYAAGMAAQSIRQEQPTLTDLRRTYAGLEVHDRLLSRLGQAIRAGSALFLYGASGNGKTTLAERITRCWSPRLWIPHALTIDGAVVRLFDPKLHHPWPTDDAAPDGQAWDERWVCIARPTIVVGGELRLENLELLLTSSGLLEAPLQLKSNGGTLVVDDFGRQRMRPEELLNRWIIPLEKGYDILNLPNGRTFAAPFQQMVVFSTNLEPRDLVDDAFLRRIPYKLEIPDPTEPQFRALCRQLAEQQEMRIAPDALDYLLAQYYRTPARPLRFCHPRDLLRQVEVYCAFHDRPAELNRESIDAAAENYFAIL